jgi:hypothetical protein
MNGQPFNTVVERTTDGREVSTTQQGRSSASSFKWDGNALVFSARAQGQNCEGTVSIRYDLEENGRRIPRHGKDPGLQSRSGQRLDFSSVRETSLILLS